MIQGFTNGGKQHHGRLRCHVLAALSTDDRQAPRQRLGHHDHARATAEGPVIHAAVVAFRMVAWVPQPHINLSAGVGTPGYAARQKGGEQLGEQGNDVKAHGAQR
ncbi:hypothetical protein D3C80_1911240 [compost metagenome]